MSYLKTRRTLDDIIRFTSSVGENSIFTGNISTSDNIVVRGTIIGDSNIKGIIVVESNGKWLGNITANILIINGQVEGNITALYKIEIQKNAKIIGNLNAPGIHMKNKTLITTFEEKRQK